MSTTERLTPSLDHTPRDTWLAPERPGEPPLRLRYEGERVTASFALTLAGVARRKAAAEPWSAGWPVLGAGQGLDAVYRVAAGRLECVLRGHGQADAAAAAVVDARALWRNLDIGLRRGLGDYHFVPSDDPASLEPPAPPAWQVVLQPLRLRIAARPPRPVRFTPADRTRHCYILGATGTGKSTLLYNLLVQDIEAGAGVCLLDPHGDLHRQVLAAVPPRRLKDVILVEPGDAERAVGINFLECGGPHPQVRMNFITNELIRIFHRLYDLTITGGPIFEQYMRNALLLVMDNEIAGGTLMDVPLLFEDERYRKELLEHCRNPYTVNFWRKQAEPAGGDSSLKNMTPYITSKLNQFTSNALLRPIIGQSRSTVDFRACLDEGRIVLVDLPKGVLGQLDTQLLGMLIIGKLFDAALQRTRVPEGQRRPFFLYVDEAHNFTTETVAHLLAEARKFGLHLTLANQNLTQMGGGLVDAILGNVGSLLLFRLGVPDAERMAPYVKPELRVRDLEDLPDRHVAARLLLLGAPSRPFVFATLPPRPVQSLDPAEQARVQAALEESRLRYTRPVAEVEEALRERRQGRRRG